jgi:anti-anti-sigma factor
VIGGDPLEVTVRGDLVVAALSGEIDLSNARPLGPRIAQAVPNEAVGVVLDLSPTTYLDSTGLHVIFDLASRLSGRQQRLAIALPEDSRVRRVLDLVDVETVAPVRPTVEEAAEVVRGGA